MTFLLFLIDKGGGVATALLVVYVVVVALGLERCIVGFVVCRGRVDRSQLISFSRGLWVLSLVAVMAPMLGLLGTMLGLIRSFRGIEQVGGAVDMSVLAGGIWEAMITTVMGLVVGLAAQFFYRVLIARGQALERHADI